MKRQPPRPSGADLPSYLKWESVGWLLGGIASGFLLDYFPVTMKHLLVGASLMAGVAVGDREPLCHRRLGAGSRPASQAEAGAAPPPAALTSSGRQNLRSMWRSLVTLYLRPEFAGLLLILFFTFFARETFFTTYGIYLTESLQGGTTLYGASIGIATLLGIFLYDAASASRSGGEAYDW